MQPKQWHFYFGHSNCSEAITSSCTVKHGGPDKLQSARKDNNTRRISKEWECWSPNATECHRMPQPPMAGCCGARESKQNNAQRQQQSFIPPAGAAVQMRGHHLRSHPRLHPGTSTKDASALSRTHARSLWITRFGDHISSLSGCIIHEYRLNCMGSHPVERQASKRASASSCIPTASCGSCRYQQC